MKTMIGLMLLAAVVSATPATAQAPREDVIWARTSPTGITLDGVLDEPVWALAESKIVTYGENAGIPGSGWKLESGWEPGDPTNITLKFLVHDNQLYMAAEVPDVSVGGSAEFNRFDGFLMDIKDHMAEGFPKGPTEYLYSWWYPEFTDPQPAGQGPNFRGRFSNNDSTIPRTLEQIAAWDAVTVVHGSTNDDDTLDTGYTVEMRFDLGVIGYDVTQPDGDVIEYNISIYDTDYYWPATVLLFTSNRVWWQDPWGNIGWYGEVRIHARPDVTTTSGPVPDVGPEVRIPNIAATPVIDGVLDEGVWSSGDTYTFDLRWDDDALRATYDGVGPYRSGQYQPPVYGGQALVLDPADATVHVYHSGTMLYFGFDVRDGVVQSHPVFERWDGFLISLEDIAVLDTDNNLLSRRLSFHLDEDGNVAPADYLLTMVQAGDAEVGLHLMAGTTVDTLGQQVDNGYSAELAIDLAAFSYPPDLGDGTLFFGVNLLDGDSFTPFSDSYGTSTWWYREREKTCCPPWAYLEPAAIGVEDDPLAGLVNPLSHSVDNPSRDPRVAFALPRESLVTLEVYDVRGRLVARRPLGVHQSGTFPLFVDRRPEAGVYLYRLLLADRQTGVQRTTLQGKTLLLK